MKVTNWTTALLTAALMLGALACGGGGGDEVNPAVALADKMGPVRTADAALLSERAELEAIRARIAEYEALAEADRSDELTAAYEADTAGLEAAMSEVVAKEAEVQAAMVEALNLALNDFQDSPETKELLDIYTREALIVSHSYIDEDARYDKAMDSLRTVKGYWEHVELPVPASLTDLISHYNNAQFLSREAFDTIENGLTKEEVLAITGPVSERNHRKDEAKKISYFVYKTKEGPIPAIYFNDKEVVYTKQWDAFGNEKEDSGDEG